MATSRSWCRCRSGTAARPAPRALPAAGTGCRRPHRRSARRGCKATGPGTSAGASAASGRGTSGPACRARPAPESRARGRWGSPGGLGQSGPARPPARIRSPPRPSSTSEARIPRARPAQRSTATCERVYPNRPLSGRTRSWPGRASRAPPPRGPARAPLQGCAGRGRGAPRTSALAPRPSSFRAPAPSPSRKPRFARCIGPQPGSSNPAGLLALLGSLLARRLHLRLAHVALPVDEVQVAFLPLDQLALDDLALGVLLRHGRLLSSLSGRFVASSMDRRAAPRVSSRGARRPSRARAIRAPRDPRSSLLCAPEHRQLLGTLSFGVPGTHAREELARARAGGAERLRALRLVADGALVLFGA